MRQLRSVTFAGFRDPQAVAAEAANEIRRASEEALSARGRFRIVLAGGTTPLASYRLLARDGLQWAGWEVYFGDERCLPAGDPERNSQAAYEALLSVAPVPKERVFSIPAELGAETAADLYAERVRQAVPFDLVLLGMGEDGHTASLFPGHPLDEERLVIPVHHAPKPPPDRVSLTISALTACRRMLVIVTGASKREALAAWRNGDDLPIARAASRSAARVLVDAAAGGDLLRGT